MKRIGGDLEISKQFVQIQNGKVVANNFIQEKINKKGITIKGYSGNKKFNYTRKFSNKRKNKGKRM
jgi:hypothetical protein